MQELGFILAGLVVGTAVGATGVGGGSLMTPILILFCGIKPAIAVGTDLLYASISKAFGVTLHGRNGSVDRSEEHTSELQSLMRISYAVFCLKKKTQETKKQVSRTTLNT